MHYLDIEIGKEYAYKGHVAKVVGTRAIMKPGREDTYFIKITLNSSLTLEVKPHELRPLPTDVTTWNAVMERPIGFRRLPS